MHFCPKIGVKSSEEAVALGSCAVSRAQSRETSDFIEIDAVEMPPEHSQSVFEGVPFNVRKAAWVSERAIEVIHIER